MGRKDYIPLDDVAPEGRSRGSQPFPSPETPSFPLHPTRDELATPDLRGSYKRISTPPRGHAVGKFYVYTWWFEWLCLLGSGVGFALTGFLLRYLHNAPIPQWASAGSGLSLNSILSVLSTMSRTSLLVPLDNALGQLMWLAFAHRARALADAELFNEAARGPWGAFMLMWRAREKGVAALGSFLVIMAVALGFTQQQLISYPTRTDLLPDPTGLTQVGRAPEFYDSYQDTSNATDGPTVPVVEFRVWASLYSSLNHYQVHDPIYRCDSGNCKYPPFYTLAVCSTCRADTSFESGCDAEQDWCWARYKTLEGHATRKLGETEVYSTIINQTASTAGSSIVDTYTLNVSSSTWPPTYAAFECHVMWCIRQIEAKVENATYSETEMSYSTAAEMQPDGTAKFSYDDGGTKKSFSVTQNSQKAYKALANDLTGWSRRSPTGRWIHSSPLFSGMAAFSVADMTVGGQHWHRHKTNPVEVMADGMSNALRSILDVDGQRVEKHTLVRVRWWWLLYPAALWVLAVVFMILVVWKTKKNAQFVGPWGCSAIAMMLWGVDESIRDRVGHWSAEQMEKSARDVKVILVRDGEWWKLKEVEPLGKDSGLGLY